MKIYRCKVCGNIITKLHDSGVLVVCCGETMGELVANTTDASIEKHVPVTVIENNVYMVKVGSEPHPMTFDHYIEWIILETYDGFMVTYLKPNSEAQAVFKTEQIVKSAYAYCNIHGLWKSDVK